MNFQTLYQALEQKRASSAWDKVQEVPLDKGKEYYSIVRKAPAMIKTDGLGQFLAFLLAKEKKDASTLLVKTPEEAEGYLYKHLDGWLKEAPIAWTRQDNTLIERIIHENSVVYRQAAQEALAYIGWLKRFAEARFGTKGP
jgi:CRISPR-associated protein Cmr5